jgi:hypothetical protein
VTVREIDMKIAILGILFGLFAGVPIGSQASAQEHHHPPQDAALHEKFYSTWMMPDAPRTSCCHNEDCAPAASRFVNGRWEARREQDENWTLIPESKIEMNRDSPDGRSHLCGRKLLGGFAVFCFIRGNGT